MTRQQWLWMRASVALMAAARAAIAAEARTQRGNAQASREPEKAAMESVS